MKVLASARLHYAPTQKCPQILTYTLTHVHIHTREYAQLSDDSRIGPQCMTVHEYFMFVRVYLHMYVCMLHVCMVYVIYTHMHVHTHESNTHACTNTHTHTYTRTHTHAHTHTCAHMHMHRSYCTQQLQHKLAAAVRTLLQSMNGGRLTTLQDSSQHDSSQQNEI